MVWLQMLNDRRTRARLILLVFGTSAIVVHIDLFVITFINEWGVLIPFFQLFGSTGTKIIKIAESIDGLLLLADFALGIWFIIMGFSRATYLRAFGGASYILYVMYMRIKPLPLFYGLWLSFILALLGGSGAVIKAMSGEYFFD